MKRALSRNAFALSIFSASTLLSAVFFLTFSIPAFALAQTEHAPLNVSTIVKLTNANRAVYGVSALSKNALLDDAAQKKANDMARKGYFAHYSPNGTSPWYWFTSVGYLYAHAGEDLAMDFSDATSLETAWMASPEHRANILRGLYTQTGIGIAHGTYLGNPATFVVQFFAVPSVASGEGRATRVVPKKNPASS